MAEQPSRHSSRSSHRTGLSVSDLHRSTPGINSNLHDPDHVPSSDHRSSMSHALRTASPTSATLGGSPITTGDPHHHRAPSLGELHQELEQEQEAQVNRLLQMIRSQQAQLQQLQQQGHHASAVDDSAASDRSVPIPQIPSQPSQPGNRTSLSQLSSSFSSRRPSRPSSTTASPSLRPLHGASGESSHGIDSIPAINDSPARHSSRDESAFYQAEAAMLSRENQMLRNRIRDLERQIGELTTSTSTQSGVETADPHVSSAGMGSASESTDKT